MHSDLYKDLEDRKKNKKPLNMIQPIDLELGRKKKLSNKSEDNEIGSNELIVENLRVYFKNKEKKKLQTFKVKVVPFYLNPNQPLLIICLEDISLFTSLRNLKSQKEFQSDLYNSSFNCLSQKFSNILSSEVIRLKNLQRQILYCKNIIQAVGNEEVKVRISKFSLSDIISKILKFYSDYNISVVHKNADRLNVQSDQFYCFKILLAILSGINLKSLIKIVTKIKQKSHYDIIKVKFKVTNCNSEDTQSLDIEENTLNNLGVYSNMNVHSITQLNNNLTQTYSNLRNTVSVLNQSSPLLLLKQKTNQTNAPFQEEQDLSFYESQGYSLVVETCDKYIKKYLQKVCFKNYIKITKKESHRIYSIGIFVDLEKITSSNETKN